MPYTRISSSRNGAEALQYVLNQQSHNPDVEKRNELVGTVGFLSTDYNGILDECNNLWSRCSSRNKVRMRRLVISFSEEELPKDDPNSPAKAMTIATEICKKYEGHPFVIAVQRDGTGGHWHCHMLSPNVNAVTYKGFTDEQTKYYTLENYSKEVCDEYLPHVKHSKAKERFSQAERTKLEQNEKIKKQNAQIREDNKITEFMNKSRPESEQAPLQELKPLNYIWKQDLKERVSAAISESKSREDFLKRCTAHGVEAEYRDATKKQPEYILYELTDTTNFPDGEKIPKNLKSKSYKLGADYDLERLDEVINQKNPKPIEKIEPAPIISHEEQEEIHEQVRDVAEMYRWAKANGMDYFEHGVYDIDLADKARDAYDEYKRNPPKKEDDGEKTEEIQTEVSEPEEQIAPIPVVPFEDETEEEESDEELFEEPEDFEPDLSELGDEDDIEDVVIGRQLSPELQDMIDSFEKDKQEAGRGFEFGDE